MNVYERLGDLAVFTGGEDPVTVKLRDALDRIPQHLYYEDYLVAVWYPAEQRHVLSWDGASVAVSTNADTIIASAAGAMEELNDVDIEVFVGELDTAFEHPSLVDIDGGRVRPGDDGGWLAELSGSGTLLGVFESITAAHIAVIHAVADHRDRLRGALRAHGNPALAGIAEARWTRPRVDIWATAEERHRLRPWGDYDLALVLNVAVSQIEQWRTEGVLPPMDYSDRTLLGVAIGWEPLTILRWARQQERPCNPERATYHVRRTQR